MTAPQCPTTKKPCQRGAACNFDRCDIFENGESTDNRRNFWAVRDGYAAGWPAAIVAGYRELRLWHWREYMRYRALEHAYEAREKAGEVFQVGKRKREYRRIANHHLWAVQTLNELFPLGDTAEKDDAK